MKIAGDTFSMLKTVYSEFHPKKLSWCMLLELKNGRKRPKTGNFAEIPRVGFGDLGGNMGRCPPNSMTHIGIPLLGFL